MILGYLPTVSVDAIAPGQVIVGLLLASIGIAMRRGSVLEDLFKPTDSANSATMTPSDINREPGARGSVVEYKGSTLLEADPSSNYERAIRDFGQDMLAKGRTVFVLTSKGSPVYLLVHEAPGVRFFVFADVSYPKASGTPLEVLVPRNDHSVLLNVMDEAVTESPEKPKAIVFDNISSMILDGGFQETYKFLRQMNEIVSRGDVVFVSIVLSKAHDDKTINVVRNLYSANFSYDSGGLHVKKQA